MYHLLPTLCSVLFVSSRPAIRVTNHPIIHQHSFYNVFSHQLRVQFLKGPHSHYPPVHRLFCPQQHWDCLAWSSIFHDAPTHPVHESFCLPEPWPQNTGTTMEVLATSDIFHPPPGNHKYDTQCSNPGICVSCISSYLHPCSPGQGGARTGQRGDGSKHRGVINNFCLFPCVANNLLGVGIFI